MLKGELEGIYSIYLGKKTGVRLLLIPLNEDDEYVKVELINSKK